MCYKGKCLCLEVETGALIFAIFNVVLNSLGSVLSIGGLVYTLIFMDAFVNDHGLGPDNIDGFLRETIRPEDKAKVMILGMASNLVCGVFIVGFCIAFSFAVVLVVGLCKRKAGLVKCYFVYGVTNMVCGAAATILIAMNGDISIVAPFLILSLVIHVVYGLILYMVRMTYKKFESEVIYHSFSNPMATIQKF